MKLHPVHLLPPRVVDVAFGLAAIASIFAIVDPLGAVPFFMVLTEGYSRNEKQHVISKACLVALSVLLVFGLAGQYIFLTFGFTIPSFQISGGALLFAVAFEMLRGERVRAKGSEPQKKDPAAREAVGVVPLGIPLLAGPGAITTVMVYMSHPTAAAVDKVFVFIGILIAILGSLASFYYSDAVSRRIGRAGAMALSRIMGVLLAAVGVQFMINGVIGTARLYGLL